MPYTPPLALIYANPLIDPFRFSEACVAKAAMSCAMGGAMGAGMGLLLGSYNSLAPPMSMPGVPDPPKIPMKHLFMESLRSTGRKSRRWGKNFALVTAVFSGIECVVEKYRAKHDVKNGVVGGCVTGAILAANQGPAGMCFGCVGFAAFSAAIESIMGH
eukprot:augustus_masked-scaffold_31-processed-gene-1.18-mRNA-1 protein AED:0.05 eAED:0.05 QI:0/-1/0/1/-1/1/1/0/158